MTDESDTKKQNGRENKEREDDTRKGISNEQSTTDLQQQINILSAHVSELYRKERLLSERLDRAGMLCFLMTDRITKLERTSCAVRHQRCLEGAVFPRSGNGVPPEALLMLEREQSSRDYGVINAPLPSPAPSQAQNDVDLSEYVRFVDDPEDKCIDTS